ncbi:hypothetical protein NSQ89_14685 [Niallia sp. FSL R7-0648]|jgi:hypothetical protein|nr:hypothetical protein [Niallia circulans]
MKKSKPCPLKLGKETYGKQNIEEAFRKALEPYFKKDDKKLSIS